MRKGRGHTSTRRILGSCLVLGRSCRLEVSGGTASDEIIILRLPNRLMVVLYLQFRLILAVLVPRLQR